MNTWPTWFVGVMVAILGVGGLYVASRADDQVIYIAGLIVFVGTTLFEFLLIKSSFDHAERH
ncbi:MAG: hypothetical protein IT564_11125 [Rhodospirillales bacterium]|nr:hypothetical protein [Rhodospirillales bacterium]